MSKVKSAVLLVLATIIIAVLCAMCSASFPIPNSVNEYHSVVSIIAKDSTLGGGYYVTYYPEGVISAEEYVANSNAFGSDTEAKEKYQAKYVSYGTGAIYLEKETVFDEEANEVSESFKEDFDAAATAVRERYEAQHIAGVKVEVCDDYTIRVFLPDLLESPSTTLAFFSYTGEFSVAYGSESDKVIEADRRNTINDYVKGVSARTVQDTSYVVIHFTDLGREALKEATSAAAEEAGTLYVMVGDNAVISLTVSSQIDQNDLYISGNYTAETSGAVSILLDKAVNGTQTDLKLTAGDARYLEAQWGENTMLFVYIGLGAFALLSALFFFVRYRALGFAHLYAYLLYLPSMALCLAFISFLHLGVGGVAAIVLSSVLMCVSNASVFEAAKKEYALGKTMVSSVKTGYKKCFWHIFDIHIALALAAVLTFAIALTELQVAAFVFLLGVIFSGVCVLGVTRLMWASMMSLSKKKEAFCNFKRGEDYDDE